MCVLTHSSSNRTISVQTTKPQEVRIQPTPQFMNWREQFFEMGSASFKDRGFDERDHRITRYFYLKKECLQHLDENSISSVDPLFEAVEILKKSMKHYEEVYEDHYILLRNVIYRTSSVQNIDQLIEDKKSLEQAIAKMKGDFERIEHRMEDVATEFHSNSSRFRNRINAGFICFLPNYFDPDNLLEVRTMTAFLKIQRFYNSYDLILENYKKYIERFVARTQEIINRINEGIALLV